MDTFEDRRVAGFPHPRDHGPIEGEPVPRRRAFPVDVARRPGSRGELEAVLTTVAPRQHGVVTRQQLLAAGVGTHVVDRAVEAGRLQRLHRGVYLAGPVVSPHAREMAAWLACGATAVISHWSAAALAQLVPRSAGLAEVEVIARAGNPRRPGIRIRRIQTLYEDEVTRIQGIPTTTPARTLFDLASCGRPRTVERALAQALARGSTRAAAIEALLERHGARPGARLLRVLLEGGPALTRSEAEERCLALIRKAQLPQPELNVRIAGYEVDFLWRQERLVVEIDGAAFHSSPAAFQSDRRRDQDLVAEGFRVVRVTWQQLVREPEAVLARLVRALAAPHVR